MTQPRMSPLAERATSIDPATKKKFSQLLSERIFDSVQMAFEAPDKLDNDAIIMCVPWSWDCIAAGARRETCRFCRQAISVAISTDRLIARTRASGFRAYLCCVSCAKDGSLERFARESKESVSAPFSPEQKPA